jgi:hypothetical protein
MVTIPIATSDSVVWDIENVLIDICHSMSIGEIITLDLLNEGPDVSCTKLYSYLELMSQRFSYDLQNITINTCNYLETHSEITINCRAPMHLVKATLDANVTVLKSPTFKHFGIFIGRSNAPRLILANHLHQLSNKTVMSYHYSTTDDFHMNFIGLEDSIKSFNVTDVSNEASFIAHCPIKLDNDNIQYPLLGVGDETDLHLHYANFFVEIVCETYYSGNTFFPTEKVWRAMAMKTPFIVHGPKNFLNNLKRIGFKTFDKWWNEGYSEDPPAYSLASIKTIILEISNKPVNELVQMHNEMHDVLEHNFTTLNNLTDKDFLKLCE